MQDRWVEEERAALELLHMCETELLHDDKIQQDAAEELAAWMENASDKDDARVLREISAQRSIDQDKRAKDSPRGLRRLSPRPSRARSGSPVRSECGSVNVIMNDDVSSGPLLRPSSPRAQSSPMRAAASTVTGVVKRSMSFGRK